MGPNTSFTIIFNRRKRMDFSYFFANFVKVSDPT